MASSFLFLVAGSATSCFMPTNPFVPEVGVSGCLVEHPRGSEVGVGVHTRGPVVLVFVPHRVVEVGPYRRWRRGDWAGRFSTFALLLGADLLPIILVRRNTIWQRYLARLRQQLIVHVRVLWYVHVLWHSRLNLAGSISLFPRAASFLALLGSSGCFPAAVPLIPGSSWALRLIPSSDRIWLRIKPFSDCGLFRRRPVNFVLHFLSSTWQCKEVVRLSLYRGLGVGVHGRQLQQRVVFFAVFGCVSHISHVTRLEQVLVLPRVCLRLPV